MSYPDQADLSNLLRRHPGLTMRGMDRAGESLLKHFDEVQKVYEWLAAELPRVHSKARHTWQNSYGLKHVVENRRQPYMYVANGVFIAAALLYGCRSRACKGTPNLEFKLGNLASAA